MEYGQLASVVEELAVLLPGARVDKILPERGRQEDLMFSLRARRQRFILLLSADRTFPRIHLASRRPVPGAVPSGFLLSLRRHLIGARISAIGLVGSDRIVSIDFRRAGVSFRILFVLFGSQANMVLNDSSGLIVASMYPSRLLLPGELYRPPPGRLRQAAPGAAADQVPGDAPGTVNLTVERSCEEKVLRQRMADLRLSLRAEVLRRLTRMERRKNAIARDLTAAEGADSLREAGQVILANLARIVRGQTEADLVAYDGRRMSVRLDPALSPQENAERYFRRARKGKAGKVIMRERLAEAEHALAGLSALQDAVAGATDLPSLEAIRQRIGVTVLRHTGVKREGRKTPEREPDHHRVRYQGWDILIGKSAAGNDHLTTDLAGTDDLWLHAEGMPGSHVLVRNPGGRDIPPDILRRAASLAAYYSRGRGAANVAVAYTLARNVRKPRGARPGTVVLAQRKTIMAVPEAADRV